MNNIDQLKQEIKLILNAAFPYCTVSFERAGEDPFLIGVGVFGVEREMVKWVESKILDLDEKLCAGSDFMLIPLVRDEDTTNKFYPQYARAWAQVDLGFDMAMLFAYEGPMDFRFLASSGSAWEKWINKENLAAAANQEFALAA